MQAHDRSSSSTALTIACEPGVPAGKRSHQRLEERDNAPSAPTMSHTRPNGAAIRQIDCVRSPRRHFRASSAGSARTAATRSWARGLSASSYSAFAPARLSPSQDAWPSQTWASNRPQFGQGLPAGSAVNARGFGAGVVRPCRAAAEHRRRVEGAHPLQRTTRGLPARAICGAIELAEARGPECHASDDR